ncbi:MAG: DNA/RNA nuclease SfsA [Leptotrichiaceae bacterium]|nr:DNA/RNA nuclease SfsA [Leptotrichiaceae bacterium]
MKSKRDSNESIYIIDYDETVIFKERKTRFTVSFDFKKKSKNNQSESENLAHLHDSGRLTELLIKGSELLIKRNEKENRKTKWDVIGVRAGDEVVLINSVYHRYIAETILNNEKLSPFGKLKSIKPEVKYKNSRIDFYLETKKDKIYLEIKGCTLIEKGIATFPGAPSMRAVKHLNELIDLKGKGFRAAVLILVFRKSEYFRPRHETDRDFAETFYKAIDKGVEVYTVLLSYENKNIYFQKELKIMGKSFD